MEFFESRFYIEKFSLQELSYYKGHFSDKFFYVSIKTFTVVNVFLQLLDKNGV